MGPLTETFDNGLRLIFMPSPTNVAYCGYTVGAGTRDEMPDEQGMAHFLEHMSFKGTEKRRSWHILNRMESVGGDLNAFTTKEETVFYCACLDRDFERAVELLTDLVFHSTFPAGEMEKELGVILDEIQSYEDTPSDLIFDEFEGLLFKGDALGNNILGVPEQLKTFTGADATRFVHRHYNPANMVFFVYGNLDWKKVLRTVGKYGGQEKAHSDSVKIRRPLPEYVPCRVETHRDTHQAHVMIGSRGLAGADPDRLALYLLNNILGGPGMNSRLNISLREKRGLVYNVESNSTSYTDTGVFCIYFGCDTDDADKCTELCLKELGRMCRETLTDSALRAARKQLMGQMGVAGDNFESVALGMGKAYLHYGSYQTRDELFRRIESITAGQMLDVARRILAPDTQTILSYR